MLDFAGLNFSVWLRTGFNPPDINRFQSDTGKYFPSEFRNKHVQNFEKITSWNDS